MSQFNPEEFLHTEAEGGFDTKYTAIPEGDYRAVVDEVSSRMTSKGQAIMDVTFNILDDELKQKLNLQKATVRMSIFLDLDESGALKKGTNANIKLGKLLEACGITGRWNPKMLEGAGPVLINVSQRKNEDDPEIVYNDVKRVAKLS
jgi:hypothetical protein